MTTKEITEFIIDNYNDKMIDCDCGISCDIFFGCCGYCLHYELMHIACDLVWGGVY